MARKVSKMANNIKLRDRLLPRQPAKAGGEEKAAEVKKAFEGSGEEGWKPKPVSSRQLTATVLFDPPAPQGLIDLLPGQADKAHPRALANLASVPHWLGERDTSAFSPELRARMTIAVPVTPHEDYSVYLVNTRLGSRLKGLPLGKYGRVTPATLQFLAERYFVHPAKEGEDTSYEAVATRYTDARKEAGRKVQGDGRVVEHPDAMLLDGVGVTQRVKGRMPTGLRALQEDYWHFNAEVDGKLAVYQGLLTEAFEGFQAINGIPTTETLAAAGSPESFTFGGGRVESGQSVEVGRFARLGHLLKAGELERGTPPVPGLLRELLNDVNAQISLELGVGTHPTLAGLYRIIVKRKAQELADKWWLRIVHGSTTITNNGLIGSVDHATSHTMGRTDPGPPPSASPGHALEPERVLLDQLARWLPRFMKTAAAGDAPELAALSRLDATQVATEALGDAMARNALEHIGLDADRVHWLVKNQRGAALQLWNVIRDISSEIEPGVNHVFRGKDGYEASVPNPARYDVMAALPFIMDAVTSPEPGVALATLQRALHPLRPEDARDHSRAEQLLNAARPLVDAALRGLSGEVKQAQIEIARDLARHVNAPVPRFAWYALHQWSLQKLADFKDGKISRARLGGEVQRMWRESIRKGPESPAGVALRIRNAGAPNFLVLSTVEEEGVQIRETSDGVHDTLRFAIAENPMGLADPSAIELRVSLREGHEEVLRPKRVLGDEIVFELPVDRAPERIIARFQSTAERTAAGTPKTWDLDGLGFGQGHQPVLASLAVDAELAAYAARKGLLRWKTSPAHRNAARSAETLRPRPRSESDPKRTAGFAPGGEALQLPDGGSAVAGVWGGRESLQVRGPGSAQAYWVLPEVLLETVPDAERWGAVRGDWRQDPAGNVEQPFERGNAFLNLAQVYNLYEEESLALNDAGDPWSGTHRLWASSAGPDFAMRELHRKVEHLFSTQRNARAVLAKYYADFSVRAMKHGLSFGNIYRDSTDWNLHFNWAAAEGTDLDDVKAEVLSRLDVLERHLTRATLRAGEVPVDLTRTAVERRLQADGFNRVEEFTLAGNRAWRIDGGSLAWGNAVIVGDAEERARVVKYGFYSKYLEPGVAEQLGSPLDEEHFDAEERVVQNFRNGWRMTWRQDEGIRVSRS